MTSRPLGALATNRVKTVGKQGLARSSATRRRHPGSDLALLEYYRATATTGVASSVLDEEVYKVRVVAPMLPPRFADPTVTLIAVDENRSR